MTGQVRGNTHPGYKRHSIDAIRVIGTD